jgi:hypothetical protein
MLNLDPTTLSAVVDQAMRDAADHPRWLNAISRAVVELLSNPYLHRQDDHSLLIASSSSDRIYSANGVCQCEAFHYGRPCWHRAASRLVRLHDEALAAAPAFICGACHTSAHPASGMQPAICTECVQAWLGGYTDRLDRAAIDARQAAAQAALDECFA